MARSSPPTVSAHPEAISHSLADPAPPTNHSRLTSETLSEKSQSSGASSTSAGTNRSEVDKINAFLQSIQRHKLVNQKKLAKAVSEYRSWVKQQKGPRASLKTMVAHLVETGLLTRWQCEQIARGRTERLRIGPLPVLGVVGEGGMGQVLLAEQPTMKRKVAVKVLPEELSRDAGYLKRFYQEARAIAALDHPNIVQAYSAEQDGKRHYLVMQFIDGVDFLRKVLADGPLAVEPACDYIRQAALGLEHAHQKGLIHRDIKPANLLVDKNGTVKLLDLGIARLRADDHPSLTTEQSGTTLGTADYMSPEQARDSHRVDTRSDLYSLGCTFYFLLTGRPPFPTGTVAERLLKHQMEQPLPISEFRSDVPEAIEEIISVLMAKDPKERFQSAQEVAEVLWDWLQNNAASGSSPGFAPDLAGESSAARLTRMRSAQGSGIGQAAPANQPTLFGISDTRLVIIAGTFAAVGILSGLISLYSYFNSDSVPGRPRPNSINSGLSDFQPDPPDSRSDRPSSSRQSRPINPETYQEVEVVRVVDGDTIEIRGPDTPVQVRLLQIDTPDSNDQGPDAENSKRFVEELIQGKTVRLEFDIKQGRFTDPYDRLLAWVFLGKTNVNVEIVRAGWSRYDTRYKNSEPYKEEFQAAELEAKADDRGRWQDRTFR